MAVPYGGGAGETDPERAEFLSFAGLIEGTALWHGDYIGVFHHSQVPARRSHFKSPLPAYGFQPREIRF